MGQPLRTVLAGPWEQRAWAKLGMGRNGQGAFVSGWVTLLRWKVWEHAAHPQQIPYMLGSAWLLLRELVSGQMQGMLGHLEAQAGQEGRVRFGPRASCGCCPGSRMGRSTGPWHGKSWPSA